MNVRELTRLDANNLPSLFLVFGDEPLQRGEAEDAIRKKAREAQIDERIVHTVTTGFDWAELAASGQTMSLFASRRLIEVYSEKAAWGRAGADALKRLAADEESPDVWLIRCGALDRRQQQSAWFKALSSRAVTIAIKDVPPARLPKWIADRARQRHLDLDLDAAGLIADRVEGNLLAAAQEIEKLKLMLPDGKADLATVLEATTDSARFDVFAMVDSALHGDPVRAFRILDSLSDEGVEPILINWALQRSLRQLAQLSERCKGGAPLDVACEELKIWRNQRPPLKSALSRHPNAQCLRLLRFSRMIDAAIKGADPTATAADPWRMLRWLTHGLAGNAVAPLLN